MLPAVKAPARTALPGPMDINRHAFAHDPLVHSLFATADDIDHMPGPFWLPADVQEGDFIEIGMLGAYGVAMSTGFNGYGEHDIAQVEDAPMASLYGLAPRSIPTTVPHRRPRPGLRPSAGIGRRRAPRGGSPPAGGRRRDRGLDGRLLGGVPVRERDLVVDVHAVEHVVPARLGELLAVGGAVVLVFRLVASEVRRVVNGSTDRNGLPEGV